MQWRPAAAADVPELARLNQQLIEDEGHANPMDLGQLERRMASWLGGRYRAILFHEAGRTLAYALYRDDERGGHHVRQFFVARDARRRGHGSRAMQLLVGEVLRPGARVALEVLEPNGAARAFYEALGFTVYAHTLERSSREARVGAYNYLQADDGVATSGIVPAAGFQRIARAGYTTVINLLPDDSEHAVAGEAELVREHGMAYVHIPVDFKRPTHDDLDAFSRAMKTVGESKVWVHCAANYRVTSFLALYAERHLGWTAERASALAHRVWTPDETWRAFLDTERARPRRAG